ncbi:unnamed protein product, partial [Allacma fusca]
GYSDKELECMQLADEYLRIERVTERQLQAAFNVLTNKANGARRRRQIESFSGGRSGTPSGFRSQPVKRSAGVEFIAEMKLTWLVLAFLAIIVHVTFGEMTPRRVQSPRVKRESIRHDSSPTAFDRTHSELQAPASQPARYVRGARPDPLVIPVPGVATVTIVTDGTGIPKTSWTPEQSAAVVSYFSKVGTAEPPTFQEYQDMIALFDTRMTSKHSYYYY